MKINNCNCKGKQNGDFHGEKTRRNERFHKVKRETFKSAYFTE